MTQIFVTTDKFPPIQLEYFFIPVKFAELP